MAAENSLHPTQTQADLPSLKERVGVWQELRDWQDENMLLVLPVLYLAAGLLIAGLTAFADTFHAGLITLFALLLPLAVFGLRRVGFRLAACVLVSGCLVIIALLLHWETLPAVLALLPFPVGLAAVLLGLPSSLGLAAVCGFLLLTAPASLSGVDASLRYGALLQVGGTVFLIWLTRRPLIEAMQWYWASYERSNELLTQARDTQVQLKQVLEDLAQANLQLTRLNRFAEAMRLSAEEARRAKQQFVANVSHELRTPLNMIIGFSEMIIQSPEVYGAISPALLSDLEIVLRNSQHLSRLIDDVLDLSQIETDQMALTMERISLAEIVDAAAIATRPLFQSKRLYLDVDVAPTLPQILCDRTRIRQVLLNLLSNAGRFTERGGVHLRAWQEGNSIVVSVTDTGPGIPPEAQAKLFQPFQQVDGTIRRRYGGSGLGLSISKSFIEMHGGRIWLESSEGSGTTFLFSLPIEQPAPLDTGYARWFNPYVTYEERTRRSLAPVPTVRPRYVVLEQGRVLQRLLSRYLEGVDIVPVPSLSAALDELRQSPAQALIVNDASVGRALQSLSEAGQLPYGTPVMVCSIPDAYEAAGDLGAYNYLVKPISRDRLLGALDRLALKGKTILIVEDDREAIRLFRRMLAASQRGYRVLRATDGQQGLQIMRREQPDAVLLDLVMPKMDGFRFLAEKNDDATVRDIPVIIISARDPTGQLIVSDVLAITQEGGLSVAELLACLRAVSGILSPASRAAGQAQPEAPPG